MSLERRVETVPVPRDLNCEAHILIAEYLTASLAVLLREGAHDINVRWVDIPEGEGNPFSRGYALYATRGSPDPPLMSVEDELRACGM